MSVFPIKNQEKFKLYGDDECPLPQLPGSQLCKNKLYGGGVKATLAVLMHVNKHGACRKRIKSVSLN